jgi:hypothetical protein
MAFQEGLAPNAHKVVRHLHIWQRQETITALKRLLSLAPLRESGVAPFFLVHGLESIKALASWGGISVVTITRGPAKAVLAAFEA